MSCGESERIVENAGGESASISLCMIVRDARQSLETALSSVRPFVDEMVVVDTGSRDGSAQVAREAGAQVFDFPWRDDFSAARNFSIEKATGDWIFWMDSDDELPPESGPRLRRLVAEHPRRDAAFWVNVEQQSRLPDGRSQTTRHAHLKLFPRRREIRFVYRVHEQVAPSVKKLGLPLKASSVTVRHSNADRSPEGNRRRIERNLRLLKLDLAEHPEDAFVLLNLGMTYLHQPDGLATAAEYTRRSIDGLPTGAPTRINAYLTLATVYRRLKDYASELETCRRAEAEFPDDISVLTSLAEVQERRGRLSEAAGCYQRILERGKLHLSVFHAPDVRARTAVRLGRLYLRMGRNDWAEQLWKKFIAKHPGARSVQEELLNLYLQSHTIIVG